MDHQHLNNLTARRPNEARATVKLFLDYHPKMSGRNVPDPYYGGPDDFKQVLDLIEEASRGLLAELKRQFTKR